MKRLIWAMSFAFLLTGCNIERVAQVTDNMGKLRGAHEARGGVILDGGKGGDWQISRCEAQPDGSIVLSTSGSKPLLTFHKSAPRGATLEVPDGATLKFSSDQCPTIKQDDAGHVTVACTGSGHEVMAGVNTVKCGG